MRHKKRWAWKPRHRRPCHKQYWYSPPSSWFYLRQYWSEHRGKERNAIQRLMADPEADPVFPFHHRHELAWTWC